MELAISSGKINRAQKVVIYGAEGVGKTTLAAHFPEPLIIDTEGGTAHMDVRRIDRPASWPEMLAILAEVAKRPGLCKTLVIDTADWAEQLAAAYVCSSRNERSIEAFGYGKGYTFLAEEFQKLLAAASRLVEQGVHVVFTAHAQMRKFEQPDEQAAFDRWEMKLSKKVAPLLKEWCDHLFFCNYKVQVVKTADHKPKARDGRRVLHTAHRPVWDAKTRADLPEEMELDYAGIAHLFEGLEPPSPPASREQLEAFFAKAKEKFGPEKEQFEQPVRNLLASLGCTNSAQLTVAKYEKAMAELEEVVPF